ncbi:MAG: hypothetical protein DRI74_07255 [Bacteroidetes bacterium]|nr:MAG: hypothetical protein DRI74_07255 [Bacteroidota bacterium]
MEIPFAGLVPALGQLGVTGYNMDMFFEGSSVYFGLQAGLTYEVNDWLSVYFGGRYIIAKNTYSGYIRNVTVDIPSGTLAPGTYVGGVAGQAADGSLQAAAGAVAAQGGSDGLIPIVDGGGGAFKLNDKFTLQFGAFYTLYQGDTFDKVDGATGIPYTETYEKNTWAFLCFIMKT